MTDFVRTGDLTDRSGTIATNATAQDVMARNPRRRYLIVQNVSSADLWIDFNTNAVANQPSLKLAPNDSYESAVDFVCTSRVSIIGATAGQAFSAKEG